MANDQVFSLMLLCSPFVYMFIIIRLNGQVVCNEPESCSYGNLTTTSEYIYCRGFRSCEKATSITTNLSDGTGKRRIDCHGSYSCYKATIIKGISTNDATDINCFSLFSCANAGLIRSNNGYINCPAEQSCANTRIVNVHPTASNDQGCSGDRACLNSQIVTRDINNIRGNLAAMNAQFYSNDSRVYYYFFAFDGGYNATVFCGNGHTCDIYCYGNSCQHLNLECVAGDDSCTFNIDCTYAQYDGNHCLYGYKLPSDIGSMPSLVNVTMSTLENSYTSVCSNYAGSPNCVDYVDCYPYKTISSTSGNPLTACCFGSWSCRYADNITTVISNNSNNNNIAIRCDAYYSCHGATGYILSKSIGAGHIFSTGYYSMSGGTGIIETTNEYNIVCTGLYSCQNNKQIQNGNNLYCTGGSSCRYISLILNFNTIYGYGKTAMIESRIEFINNIYCGGSQSCLNTTIFNVYDSVYGNNYQVLYESNISNVANDVISLGYQSMYQSTVYNVTNVYCISFESCKNTYLVGIHNKIEANGMNALSGSIIISETNFNESGLLFIYINGTNDDEFDIYCNETDICKIECQSSYACANLSLHCGTSPSRCYVKCDDSGAVYCPNSGVFHEWTTFMPSVMPSVMPSNMPSRPPTRLPSVFPSAMPSEIPSETPSGVPSEVPTTFPNTITTNESGTANNSNNSGSEGGGIDDNTLILVAILVGGLLLCVCMILLFTYSIKYKQWTKESNTLQTSQTEMEKKTDANNRNGRLDLSGDANVGLFGPDGQRIDLQSIASNTNTNVTATPRGMNETTNNIIENTENSLDSSLVRLFEDVLTGSNTYDDDGGDKIVQRNTSMEMEGLYKKGEVSTRSVVYLEGNTEGQRNYSVAHAIGDPLKIDCDSNYQKWTQKQVILWIKDILFQNGLSNQVIVTFLKEFSEKRVNGKVLDTFVQDQTLIGHFMAQMSLENQRDSIWNPIKSAMGQMSQTGGQ